MKANKIENNIENNIESEIETPKYKLSEDKKMIGVILLILAVSMQVFAFLNVPFFTTIHSYTIGMLLGAYNPLFYGYIIYISLLMVFKDKVVLPSWIKLTKWTYLFVAISIVFIGSSTGDLQSQIDHGWTVIGGDAFKQFPNWYKEFTEGQSAWYPHNINGGLLGVFLFSITAMVSSGIGAFIISIVLLVLSISVMATGTIVGLYKGMIKKRNLDLKKHRISEDKKVSFDRLEVTTREDFVEKPKEEVKKQKKEEPNDVLPFDDPFA
ncbi:MAG: hypothetical protein KAG04_02010 [Mycoplasmataceae bacterium]|nr:hypothetical protein [Mycoplasmataceae bacterium]